ncbi:hypothetical protein K461DRAFT_298079 [Myriangium duriaei CBS 260.36]|uniref:Uncharacterized protein n=1 Tax=Myriangium duriaei CBS 260.36 TaxID=1168546 RepID=A0A9P4IW53_9PEZI|nr:hypothetical protein K461DRAFT_298079 [Myriangium duriaei CBS 260.36]
MPISPPSDSDDYEYLQPNFLGRYPGTFALPMRGYKPAASPRDSREANPDPPRPHAEVPRRPTRTPVGDNPNSFVLPLHDPLSERNTQPPATPEAPTSPPMTTLTLSQPPTDPLPSKTEIRESDPVRLKELSAVVDGWVLFYNQLETHTRKHGSESQYARTMDLVHLCNRRLKAVIDREAVLIAEGKI